VVTANRLSNENSRQHTFYTMAHANVTNPTFPEDLEIPFSTQSFDPIKFNKAMQKKFDCTLSYCSINIGICLDELAHGETVDAESVPYLEYDSMEDIEPFRERLINLSFLDDLRIKMYEEYENVEEGSSNDEEGSSNDEEGSSNDEEGSSNDEEGSASSEESTDNDELEDNPQPSGEEMSNDGTESTLEWDEPFFPTRIYVRNNMRKIFGLYLNDVGKVQPGKRPTVLIGSPGVGKSVLFFLAAMYRCSQKAEKKKVVNSKKRTVRVVNTCIYYRWAGSEEKISVFIMFRDNNQEEGERKVHVLFTRSLNENNFSSLSKLDKFIWLHLKVTREHYFAFVDGPNHTETNKTLKGKYDYFCTSGGIPTFKDEQFNFRRWILNGWTKDEALQALITLHVYQDTPTANGAARTKEDTASEMDDEFEDVLEKARRAYWLCGGRIRGLRKAYDDYEKAKVRIETSLAGIQTKDIKLAGDETAPIEGKQLDRMRTMFRAKTIGSDEVMGSFFVVEAPFKLQFAAMRLGVDRFIAAYHQAKKDGTQSIRGSFFEMAIHQWILTHVTETTKALAENPVGIEANVTMKSSPISTVLMSKGKAVEGVGMLTKRNMYWVPSVGNFDNIDSAVVINNNLHVFQMTIKKNHDFNPMTFIEKFGLPVWEMLHFKYVFIHIVTPSDIETAFDCIDFTEKQLDEKFARMDNEPPEENDKGYFDIKPEPLLQIVDMSSVDTLGTSMTSLLGTLTVDRTVGKDPLMITDRVKRWFMTQSKIKKAEREAKNAEKKAAKRNK
jgi:hypothetical protein